MTRSGIFILAWMLGAAWGATRLWEFVARQPPEVCQARIAAFDEAERRDGDFGWIERSDHLSSVAPELPTPPATRSPFIVLRRDAVLVDGRKVAEPAFDQETREAIREVLRERMATIRQVQQIGTVDGVAAQFRVNMAVTHDAPWHLVTMTLSLAQEAGFESASFIFEKDAVRPPQSMVNDLILQWMRPEGDQLERHRLYQWRITAVRWLAPRCSGVAVIARTLEIMSFTEPHCGEPSPMSAVEECGCTQDLDLVRTFFHKAVPENEAWKEFYVGGEAHLAKPLGRTISFPANDPWDVVAAPLMRQLRDSAEPAQWEIRDQ